MSRIAVALVALTLLAAAAPLTAEQEQHRIQSELHIKALRPGVSVDPKGPNPVNYDEAKANPYPNLPDPLRAADGTPIASRDAWWQIRRQEIAEGLEYEVYGHLHPDAPLLKWIAIDSVPDKVGKIAARTTHYSGRAGRPDNAIDVRMTVFMPAKTSGPVPVILLLSGSGAGPASTWREQVLAKGWAAAVLDVTTVQPDYAFGLSRGVIGITAGGKPRRTHDWGVLRAWAWGASRAMDRFEEDPAIDSTRIGIAGHGLFGKAALVAMGNDPRFVIAYISSSGIGGAGLLRRNFGERLENLASRSEFHRFAPQFLLYAGPKSAKDLPVDTHELIALAAPRPIFFGAGSKGDEWNDPRGTFMAAVAAGPVYELLGKKGLGTKVMPPVGKALTSGELAFRQHGQGDTMEPNWPAFIAYAQRYLKPHPKVPPKHK